MRLLVSMGLKPGGNPREPLRPCLREVNFPQRRILRELTWASPPNHIASNHEHQEFTAACRVGRTLVQPTRTELLWIDLDRFEVQGATSNPLFYDLHNVDVADRTMLVSCAGHESVLEIDSNGTVLRHHWLRDGDFQATYGTTDFRTVPFDRFKPHSHHPNFAFWLSGAPWVTVLTEQRAQSLDGRLLIPFPEGPPHDGRLREGLLWFTTVTGHVIGIDPIRFVRVEHYDLNLLSATREALGWCRGVEVVGRRLFVGMTTLRSSRWRELARQAIRGEAGRKRPTRIVEIDRDTGTIVSEMTMGNTVGGQIYSIIHADDP